MFARAIAGLGLRLHCGGADLLRVRGNRPCRRAPMSSRGPDGGAVGESLTEVQTKWVHGVSFQLAAFDLCSIRRQPGLRGRCRNITKLKGSGPVSPWMVNGPWPGSLDLDPVSPDDGANQAQRPSPLRPVGIATEQSFPRAAVLRDARARVVTARSCRCRVRGHFDAATAAY
jgi:hypothetical protein